MERVNGQTRRRRVTLPDESVHQKRQITGRVRQELDLRAKARDLRLELVDLLRDGGFRVRCCRPKTYIYTLCQVVNKTSDDISAQSPLKSAYDKKKKTVSLP